MQVIPDAYDIDQWGEVVDQQPGQIIGDWAPARDGLHRFMLNEELSLDVFVEGLSWLERQNTSSTILVCAHSGASGRSFRRHPVRRSGVSGHSEPMPLSLVS